MKKGVTFGVLVVLAMIGAGAVVLLERQGVEPVVTLVATTSATSSTETPPEMVPVVPRAVVSTEGWKTCRNERYGFEFKFPPERVLYTPGAYRSIPDSAPSTNCDRVTHGLSLATQPITSSAEETTVSRLVVSIEYLNREFSGSPTTTIQTLNTFASRGNRYFSTKKSYLVDGVEGALVEIFHSLDRTKNYRLEILPINREYLISINTHGDDPLKVTYPDLDPTLETIFSTFKFIEKTPAQ